MAGSTLLRVCHPQPPHWGSLRRPLPGSLAFTSCTVLKPLPLSLGQPPFWTSRGVFPAPAGSCPCLSQAQAGSVALGAGPGASDGPVRPSMPFPSPKKVEDRVGASPHSPAWPKGNCQPGPGASCHLLFLCVSGKPPSLVPRSSAYWVRPPVCQPQEILIARLPKLYNYRLWPRPITHASAPFANSDSLPEPPIGQYRRPEALLSLTLPTPGSPACLAGEEEPHSHLRDGESSPRAPGQGLHPV